MPAKVTTTKTAATEAPDRTRVSLVPATGPVRHSALTIMAREFRLAENGQIRAMKSGVAKVRLSRRAGQIARWGDEDDATVQITADGYGECNRVASVSVITPPEVVVPGVGKRPNPFNVIDDSTGCFRASYIRKVAIAPGPLGNVCIVDRTLLYSLTAYLIEDLSHVSRFNPGAVMLGVKGVSPADVIADVVRDANDDIDRRVAEAREEKGRSLDWLLKKKIDPSEVERVKKKYARGVWQFFQVEASTGLGYWVDYSSPAVQKVFLNYVQGQKFGDRKAESIATRNVLRHHPLLPAMKVSDAETFLVGADGSRAADPASAVDRVALVNVFFHEFEGGRDEIERIFDEYDRGIRTAGVSVNAESAVEQSSREDDDGSGREEGDGHTVSQPADEVPLRDQEPERPDEIAALLSRVATGEQIAGEALVKKAIEKYPNLATPEGRRAADGVELMAYIGTLNSLISARDAGPQARKAGPAPRK